MLNFLFRKGLAIGIIVLFIGMSVSSSTSGIGESHDIEIDNKNENTFEENIPIENDTEYWALLIYMGIYAGYPEHNFPPESLEDFEKLPEKLLISEHWKEENIRVITGKKAFLLNIIRGFGWLDKKEDENDISVVFISTHGGQLKRDKWPWDEWDGQDEVLVTYLSFMFPWLNIRDDILNHLLSSLDSKGTCVMIDSCHAGGFNDTPYSKNYRNDDKIDADEWMHEFAEDISESGRIVLMSCSENESCYGRFTYYLIPGLTGYADANMDDLVSAEEVFDYIVEKINGSYDVNPTIYDDYPGELYLTRVELPPTVPETPVGQVFGDTNTSYNYSTVSTDPEGGKISYGWDWNGDFEVDEWTGPFDSNVTVNISHSWAIEGTYNVEVRAKDDHGLLSDWSNHTVVIMCDDNIPDQWQRETDSGCWLDYAWVAQSFTPSLDTLSKVDIAIMSLGHGDPKPLHLSIRDNLTGNNLTESSLAIYDLGGGKWSWYTFDFDDIDITIGETYFIVCKGRGDWSYKWKWKLGNPYVSGEAFHSWDGIEWNAYDADCCFVTWAVKT